MNIPDYRPLSRRLILMVIALMFCSVVTANRAETPDDHPLVVEESSPGAVHLVVSGASGGITTDYFEQIITDAVIASGIFSGIDSARAADTVIPMLRGSSTFHGMDIDTGAPYVLKIRIIKIDAPSFSIRMTVGMNAVWTLYRTTDDTTLLSKNIYSTYTGGAFEGGLIGANRVIAGVEGAERENIRIGMEMLESLNLQQEWSE